MDDDGGLFEGCREEVGLVLFFVVFLVLVSLFFVIGGGEDEEEVIDYGGILVLIVGEVVWGLEIVLWWLEN